MKHKVRYSKPKHKVRYSKPKFNPKFIRSVFYYDGIAMNSNGMFGGIRLCHLMSWEGRKWKGKRIIDFMTLAMEVLAHYDPK